MDDFVVGDDHQDTDKEAEDEDEGDLPSEEGGEKVHTKKKKALKKELKGLSLSSGEVGAGFAVATEGLGKRTRRQTDHLAQRIFQAGEIEREIDCYDTYDHEKKVFKKEAYHKANSTRTLWHKPKKSALLAITTGSNADWAKRAMQKKRAREGEGWQQQNGKSAGNGEISEAALKKTKPGQRPCAAAAHAVDKKKKQRADIRRWLTR